MSDEEKKNDPQAIGSAQTYTRRYALLALCGVAADDDDDGKAGSTPARRRRPSFHAGPSATRPPLA